MAEYKFRYICSKPVKFDDLDGARWRYVESPQRLAENMAGSGCPISEHEHGVIATDRFLLAATIEKAGLTQIKA